MSRLYFAFALTVLASLCASGQPGPHHMGPPGSGPGDFAFLGGQFGFGKVVTGAPYSAQVTTQMTQTLADGTHIQRSATASVARDSQGRSRREETMSGIGRLAASSAASGGAARTTVFIHDPVASMSYVLDPNAHTVRQMQISSNGGHFGHGQAASDAAPRARPNRAAATTEDLGTQVIAGVNATGKRITRTISAGAEGNDRDLSVTTETWYSPDLQVVVMSKSSDPRFGERVYQLTNITRAEPDASLFAVPSGYTVQQGRPPRGQAPPQ
jgi:hypothetical protein